MCPHDEVDKLLPGVCISCECNSPARIGRWIAKAIFDNASWVVIALAVGYIAAHLAVWAYGGFDISR